MFEVYDAGAEADDQREDNSGMFLSVGDLMSGLLMVFALLFIAVQLQVQHLEQELQAKMEELRRFEEAFDKLPLVILAAVEEKLGGENVKVDPKTGDVSIGDRILFDENSALLREEGKTFLREFIPIYSQIIFSEPEFDQQIAYVVVEGHTSSAGTDEANLALSLNRALAVSNFIFSEEMNFPSRNQFRAKVLSAGRGEVDARQDIDDPSDRRVLFRFQFRRQDFRELTQQGEEFENRVQENQS